MSTSSDTIESKATAPPGIPQSELPVPHSSLGRANGKVARLSKPIRDQINDWLLDGVSYPDIIERLGEQGKNLKPDNLSQWKKREHQVWLAEQAFLAQTRARQESTADLARDFDATQVNHAALQLGTLYIFEALRDLTADADARGTSLSSSGSSGGEGRGETSTDKCAHYAPEPQTETIAAGSAPSPWGEGRGEGDRDIRLLGRVHGQESHRSRSTLDQKLGGDSAAFARLLNALCRASKETMLLQKFRDTCAKARAALQTLHDPKRKLTDDERRSIVLQVDDILGLSSGGSGEPAQKSEDDEPTTIGPGLALSEQLSSATA